MRLLINRIFLTTYITLLLKSLSYDVQQKKPAFPGFRTVSRAPISYMPRLPADVLSNYSRHIVERGEIAIGILPLATFRANTASSRFLNAGCHDPPQHEVKKWAEAEKY